MFVDRILSGNARAIARAATLVENRSATPLLKELFPHSGRALVAGITGAPGAGKSTFAGQLVRVLRSEGKRVGVIAVDPTSPYSGGAILGDRIRMLEHHSDPGVFIRSMATRGCLGGLAPAAADMTILFDAAGCDVVLVETVGVGQDEVEIAKLADVTIVVLTPNAGDDVQVLKAGIMEIADVFVLNKSDLDGADKLERELKASFTLSHRPDGWIPLVVRTIASDGKGVAEVLAAAREYEASGLNKRRRSEVWAGRLREMLRERLLERYDPTVFAQAAEAVLAHETDPYTVIEELLGKTINGA
jgi:LAO/AO transport system kinase